MKIFNWMQKRFHHKDENKSELKQVALVDEFDGILTIGTLGFDPLKPFNQHNEYIVLEEDDIDYSDQELHSESDDDDDDVDISNVNGGNEDEDEDEDEEEEENPLIYTRFQHNFDKSDEKMGINSSGEECDVERKEKGERITLAELFMADSEMKKEELAFVEIIETTKKLAKKPPKNGLSFAKKFIPHVGEDSRPIKKIHQLMKRMLKRKIHPEVEGKDNPRETTQVSFSKGNEISESVFLLPTHPAAGPTV
ncbi:protein TILLER ANGLE CONTROL 1 [Euphorbia lathyris]|uniref:protein TILLER ANGLE CONTROL 1 n=1 Tax=Euphorbia lathyris TaxID=212925 RepID=UPI0033144092